MKDDIMLREIVGDKDNCCAKGWTEIKLKV